MKRKKFVKQLMAAGLCRNYADMAAMAVQVVNGQYSHTLDKLLELRTWHPFGMKREKDWSLAVALACINILRGKPLEAMPAIKVVIKTGGGGNE